jgi:hypothetical protein
MTCNKDDGHMLTRITRHLENVDNHAYVYSLVQLVEFAIRDQNLQLRDS